MPLLGGESEPGTFRPIKVDDKGRVYILVDNEDPLKADVDFPHVFGRVRDSKQLEVAAGSTATYELARPGEPVRLVFTLMPDGLEASVAIDQSEPLNMVAKGTPVVFDLIDGAAVKFTNKDTLKKLEVSIWELEIVAARV